MSGGDAISWRIAGFEEMSVKEAHALFALRQRVFVIEQACLFPEIDGRDPDARHLMGWREGELVACARLLPAGAKMQARSIGRIATAASARGRGLGRETVARAMSHFLDEDRIAPIDLSAQAHLERFYASCGFRTIGAPYDEDGIAHVDMRFEPVYP